MSEAKFGRGVLVRVKNVPELVRDQAKGWKGEVGKALASTLFDDTIESKVYSEMKKKLVAGFKESGVDADVQVVQAADYRATTSTFLKHAAVGAGAVGVGWGLWQLAKMLWRK